MALLSLALLGVIIAIVISLAVHAIRERRSYFSRRSIPTPPIPSLFLGHLGTLWTTRLPSDQFYRWTKQYGSVYGLFEGFRPMLVTSDVNFVEEVFVKQFARFPARRRALLTRALGEKRENLFSAHSLPVWRRQRKILQPVFGGLKMKRLVPTIETCMNVFMVKLSETVDTTPVIDMCELYKRATMDVICRCAFSIDTGVQSDADRQNIYMKKVGELFAHDPELTLVAKLHRITSHTVLAYISMVLFHVRRLIHGKGMSLQANLWLLEHMHEFIQQRLREMATGSSGNDLVQLMVDAVQSEKESLTSGELLSNVFIVLVAGFETTSTTLAYSTYRLALHQDIQQQLYEELVEHPSLDAESIGKLTMLELFVREVLRMHPPAPLVIDRQCEEDTHIAGHDIPKGMLIKVDVLSVHYDQDLWGPEPVDEFCMDRHREKRHPMAWIPFGAGPRICVGMSFALMEVKLCLARLIKTYRILPPSSEPFELDISEQITRTPEKVCVRLEKRIEVDAQS